MKVTLPDQTIIECTMDEMEELVARGIIGNKLNETKDSLGIDSKPTPTPKWPSTPKMPTPWTEVVAVYGCVTPNLTCDELKFDQSGFKSVVDSIQKVDGTVLINEKNEET